MHKLIGILSLTVDHLFEFIRFVQFSNGFSLNSSDKLRGKIVFRYHSIEKGLINDPIRYRFGKIKIQKLLRYLSLWVERKYSTSDSQFLTACSVVKSYMDLHIINNIDISDIINEKENCLIDSFSGKQKGGTIQIQAKNYFNLALASFDQFSSSRRSVRHFNGQMVDVETIGKVIQLAGNAPSVCNRQGYKVKLINNPILAGEILKIQGGLNSTANTVRQLIIVSVDRSVFVSSAEWYEVFIDGGIYLQNLLYSLHFYRIAAVALNWTKHFFLDKKIEKLIGFPKQEKIIAIVAIGYPVDSFKIPFSQRKKVNETLDIIN
ncbi:MAG: nitroreductase family protein [Salinivirgaceae bacterium]|nr:nitroreductase family protein [Salinivirgaceae bacterium]